MIDVYLVVAASENNVIGKDNRLLWRLPNDMAFFKNVTWGMPVVMGRKTFISLGRPLAGRTNIVITRNREWQADGIVVVQGITEALQAAAATDARQCYVIGGGEIYRETIGIAARIYLTRVHTDIQGDAFFPKIENKDWELAESTLFEADNRHAFSYSFEVWERKR